MANRLHSSPLQMIAAGGRLKNAMTKRRIGVMHLANATGISHTTIYHFLNGKREMHLDDMRLLGSALQVSPSWLAWGE